MPSNALKRLERSPMWCGFVTAQGTIGEMLSALKHGIQDAGGDADQRMDRLRLDEEFARHVGKVMAEFPSLVLLPDVLEGVCGKGAAEHLQSYPQDDDFDFVGFESAIGHVVGRKDFSRCRVTYPFPMTKDGVSREVERIEGGWKLASFLDLGAFLAISQITLPEEQHLFAPATCCLGRNLYMPYLKDGKLGRFPCGMDTWTNDLILVWRESQ